MRERTQVVALRSPRCKLLPHSLRAPLCPATPAPLCSGPHLAAGRHVRRGGGRAHQAGAHDQRGGAGRPVLPLASIDIFTLHRCSESVCIFAVASDSWNLTAGNVHLLPATCRCGTTSTWAPTSPPTRPSPPSCCRHGPGRPVCMSAHGTSGAGARRGLLGSVAILPSPPACWPLLLLTAAEDAPRV